jgi:hypothetical protein
VRRSKSEAGERLIAISPMLRDVLSDRYRRTSFRGDDERVFCHPTRGTVYRAETFDPALKAALAKAGVDGHDRAFHDLRHASLTNGAAAGESPIAPDDPCRPHEHEHDQAVSASGRDGVPGRGRPAGTAASRRLGFYLPERT